MVPYLLGLILFLLFSSPAWASNNVVLNEIYPHPTSGEKEWVEIFNPTNTPLLLDSWKIKEQTSSGTEVAHTLPTITLPSLTSCSYDFSSSSLNNNTDTVSLVNSNEIVVDSYTYTTTQEGKSFARIPEGDLWSSGVIQTKSESCATFSTLVNSPTPTLTITSAPLIKGIYLNEVMVNPTTGNNEWVEIYNNNLVTVNISGYKIDDAEGGSSPITLPEESTVVPKGYLYYQLTSAIYNNDTDSVRLLSPSGEELDKFTYSSSDKGSSWAKKSEGTWIQTTLLTMGTSNQFPSSITLPPKANTPTIKNTPTKTASVLGETITATPLEATESTTTIKLFDEKNKDEDPKVLGQSSNNYLSWVVVAIGIIIIASPVGLYLKKKHG